MVFGGVNHYLGSLTFARVLRIAEFTLTLRFHCLSAGHFLRILCFCYVSGVIDKGTVLNVSNTNRARWYSQLRVHTHPPLSNISNANCECFRKAAIKVSKTVHVAEHLCTQRSTHVVSGVNLLVIPVGEAGNLLYMGQCVG